MIRASFYRLPGDAGYPTGVPFDPPVVFPEFSVGVVGHCSVDPQNAVYGAVRQVLLDLGLDRANINTPEWNPFREFVGPGATVLIKPNLVHHRHPKGDQGLFWTISHPAVLRPLLDYALLAVGPGGSLTVADNPIENCVFDVLCRKTGLAEMIEQLNARGYGNVELLDLRTYETTQYPDSTVAKRPLPGDPRGYTDLDLAQDSMFQELEDRLGVQNYYTLADHNVDHIDPHSRAFGSSNAWHGNGRHRYRIPNSILDADLVVSVAKLKTHKFSGVTLCLKNAIGIAEGKEFLPHRRPGAPGEGGDSFPWYPSRRYTSKLRLKRLIASAMGGRNALRFINLFRKMVPARLPHELYSEPMFGDWFGNDTIWRTTLDLNLVLAHGTRGGMVWDRKVRAFLGVIDGVVGMDHEAPMQGLPVYSNIIVGGRDPVAVDTLATFLMGLDPRSIPTIAEARRPRCKSLGDPTVRRAEVSGNVGFQEAQCKFVPTKGWGPALETVLEDWPFTD